MTGDDRPTMPPVRLPSEAELARDALAAPLLARAVRLARWAGAGRARGRGHAGRSGRRAARRAAASRPPRHWAWPTTRTRAALRDRGLATARSTRACWRSTRTRTSEAAGGERRARPPATSPSARPPRTRSWPSSGGDAGRTPTRSPGGLAGRPGDACSPTPRPRASKSWSAASRTPSARTARSTRSHRPRLPGLEPGGGGRLPRRRARQPLSADRHATPPSPRADGAAAGRSPPR